MFFFCFLFFPFLPKFLGCFPRSGNVLGFFFHPRFAFSSSARNTLISVYAFSWFGEILWSASQFPSPWATMMALRHDCYRASLTTPQEVWSIWKLVELKMLDFSNHTRFPSWHRPLTILCVLLWSYLVLSQQLLYTQAASVNYQDISIWRNKVRLQSFLKYLETLLKNVMDIFRHFFLFQR